MRGLNLLKSVEPDDSGKIVTSCLRGSTGGRLWQLQLRGSRRDRAKIETTSEVVIGDDLWKSYDVAGLSPGVYEVESPHNGVVFLELSPEGELDDIKSKAAAWRLLERRR